MAVFTILCHGSGGHRSKPDKEIVAFLGRRMAGTEYEDYLILDGVGGTPQDKSGKNPMAGTFDWADKNKGKKSGKVSVEMGGSNTKAGSAVAGGGRFKYGRESAPIGGAMGSNIVGYGVEDNARHAIVTIANLPQLPDTINLIGWSRGAVTALVIANMLYDPTTTEGLFRQIDLNIFAVDPVAGDKAGTKDGAESRRLITSNVKNYLGCLNTGENRNTFSPQDLSRVIVADAAQSNVMFLPFPGKHDSCAQNSNPKAREVSDIAWSMAFRFLQHFGTQITPTPMTFGDRDCLARYCAITVKGDEYGKVKQSGFKQFLIGKGFGERSMKSDLASYTRNSDYFVNEHHGALFERLMPRLHSWLFTKGQLSPGLASRKVASSSPIGQEIAAAGAVGAHVLPSLALLGVSMDDGGFVTLPAPGSGMDDKDAAYRQAGGALTSMGVFG
jgi:hypothetical protein